MDQNDLNNRFSFHPATAENNKGPLHDTVRMKCLELASSLNALIPEGREKSLVITHIEEAMFWANAAVARL